MRLVKNRRRALSTVVTTAIMLTAVAAIGTAVVAWSNTNLRTFEFNLANSASDKTNKINEMLTIENVVLVPSLAVPPFTPAAINITVTNFGTIGLNVTQIQASDTAGTSIANNNVNLCSYFTCPSTLSFVKAKSSGWFYKTFPWQSNKIVTVQAITARGTTVITQGVHP